MLLRVNKELADNVNIGNIIRECVLRCDMI